MLEHILTSANFNSKLSSIDNNMEISITKEISLDTEKITQLVNMYPDIKINILSGYDQEQTLSNPDCLFDEEETKILVNNVNIIKEKTGKTVTFDNQFTIEQALNASRKVNDIVETIKNARVGNRPLSPYEKFLYAYSFVTNRAYKNAEENEDSAISRNLISVLNGDKIVCVGYANLLNTICKRLDIPCTLMPSSIKKDDESKIPYENHLACLVRIEDPLYDLKGIYYSDPTADRLEPENSQTNSQFTMSLVKLEDVQQFMPNTIYLQKRLQIYEHNLQNPRFKIAPPHYNEPILMSYLFPEISHGLNQVDLLYEQASQELEKSNARAFIESKIEALSEEEMIDSLKAKYINELQPKELDKVLKDEEQFKQFTIETLKNMLNDGFSKSEAIAFLRDIYDVNKFIESQKTRFSTPLEKEWFDYKLYVLRSHVNNLEDIANSIDFKIDINSIKRRTGVWDSLTSIVTKCLTECCFNKTTYRFESNFDVYSKENYPIPELGALIQLGLSKTEIESLLKEELEKFDLRKTYLSLAKLDSFTLVNDKEAYLTPKHERLVDKDYYYNEPYKEKYEDLTTNATRTDLKKLGLALCMIYISKGLSKEEALEKARKTLINTVDYEHISKSPLTK